MKITIEIPDESRLVTLSIACQHKENPQTLQLGVFPLASEELKDGNIIDVKTAYDNAYKKSEDTK